jgi:hypothetical protein
VLLATIAEASDFVEVTLFTSNNLSFLHRFRPDASSIADHDTPSDLFAAIDPE